MEFTNEMLAQGIGGVDARTECVELTLPLHVVEDIEKIVPISEWYSQDIIYADLLMIGLSHLDELSLGDPSKLL